MILAVSEAPDYAFPHSAQDESRRLELLEQRLDPLMTSWRADLSTSAYGVGGPRRNDPSSLPARNAYSADSRLSDPCAAGLTVAAINR
jgi:hypothetical protein